MRSGREGLPSRRVVEDDADRVTIPRAHAADTMPEVDPIHPARALDRALMDGEDDRIPLPKGHDLGAGLHARPLFREHELAAREVPFGLGQEDGDLKRKTCSP